MEIGVASLILLLILSVVAVVVAVTVFHVRRLRRQGREAGYDKLGDYFVSCNDFRRRGRWLPRRVAHSSPLAV